LAFARELCFATGLALGVDPPAESVGGVEGDAAVAVPFLVADEFCEFFIPICARGIPSELCLIQQLFAFRGEFSLAIHLPLLGDPEAEVAICDGDARVSVFARPLEELAVPRLPRLVVCIPHKAEGLETRAPVCCEHILLGELALPRDPTAEGAICLGDRAVPMRALVRDELLEAGVPAGAGRELRKGCAEHFLYYFCRGEERSSRAGTGEERAGGVKKGHPERGSDGSAAAKGGLQGTPAVQLCCRGVGVHCVARRGAAQRARTRGHTARDGREVPTLCQRKFEQERGRRSL
jgi:hypothetical protein